MKTISITIATILLTGCASMPADIQATSVPSDKYSKLSCEALNSSLSKEKANLETLSKEQSETAKGDALSVFMFGIPASAFNGDNEKAISDSKGSIEAYEKMISNKNCI